MKEALKLALEALEDFADVIKYDNEQDDIGSKACCGVLSYHPHSESCKAKQAITAIKAALAQPAQEPVAWMDIDEKGSASGLRYWSEPDNRHEVALYTTPPQRTWVGLTDEEITKIFQRNGTPNGFARAIEKALKEKNT